MKKEYIAVLVLILLPYITVYEKTDYFKVLNVHCYSYFPEISAGITRNLEGFKKYIFWHDYLEFPNYMFKDSDSY